MLFLITIGLLIVAVAVHGSSGNLGMLLLGLLLLPAWWWHMRGTQAGVMGPPILADPVMNAGMLIVLLALSVTVVATAFLGLSQTVVLSDGSHKLRYDCDHFRPQAATGDHIRVVINELANVVRDAAEAGDVITLSSLSAAEKASDLRAMERVIVEYKCAHR